MSLVTTCPACGTAFRVTPEQLSAHRGDVRCGQCQHIFNALQKLEEITPPDSMPLTHPVPVSHEIAVTDSEQTVIFTPAELATPEAPQQVPVIDEALLDEAVPIGEAVDFELEFPEEAVVERIPEQDELAVETPASVEVALEPIEPKSGSVAPQMTVSVPAEPQPAALTPRFLHPETPRDASLWLLVPLTLLLLAVALAQTAYFMRTEIAAHYPAMRPWLEKVCSRLACSVELPRQADLLNIEDSDLQTDVDHIGVLVLVSALYNRAPYPQAYPLLELTLTDTYDKPVLRRTFTPQEYLPAGTDLKTGLAAGGELRSRLSLSVDGEKPAGYRLYVRY